MLIDVCGEWWERHIVGDVMPEIAARNGIKLVPGAWIYSANEAKQQFGREAGEVNGEETRALIRMANQNPNIERVLVGNENILRWDGQKDLRDPNATLNEMAGLVAEDPALSAQVLRLDRPQVQFGADFDGARFGYPAAPSTKLGTFRQWLGVSVAGGLPRLQRARRDDRLDARRPPDGRRLSLRAEPAQSVGATFARRSAAFSRSAIAVAIVKRTLLSPGRPKAIPGTAAMSARSRSAFAIPTESSSVSGKRGIR